MLAPARTRQLQPQVRPPLWWSERSLHGRNLRPPPLWRPGSPGWRGGRGGGGLTGGTGGSEATLSNVSHLNFRVNSLSEKECNVLTHLQTGGLVGWLTPPSPEQVVVTTWRPLLRKLIQLLIGGGKYWSWWHSLNKNNFGNWWDTGGRGIAATSNIYCGPGPLHPGGRRDRQDGVIRFDHFISED